ncbi:hypothetical protein BRADI_3g04525v3 [Brachypodium distachyon]|uniref:Translation machinery associated TMA7 n=1 Tax=Brachypodium distachyon TaxID=15368 RepID=A0A2K2CV71_BRADI|nr:hypothetical protein BRADI_3g04525v3 [Brachypodium distachyon]
MAAVPHTSVSDTSRASPIYIYTVGPGPAHATTRYPKTCSPPYALPVHRLPPAELISSPPPDTMSKQGGKQKPLKAPKAQKKEYDETDLDNLKKKKDEEKALKELRAKAAQKGALGGAGLKKSGKK